LFIKTIAMALKIIGTGMGRTGTHSLKLALEHLVLESAIIWQNFFSILKVLCILKQERKEKTRPGILYLSIRNMRLTCLLRYFRNVIERELRKDYRNKE